MKRSLLVLPAVVLIGALMTLHPVWTKSLWQDKNVYSAGESLKVGDVIIVHVNDISQMKFSLSINSDNSFNIVSNPDAGLTGFLPKVGSNKKMNSTDKTEIAGKGTMKISVASSVIKRMEDGKLQVGGSREYSFNGVVNRFVVSGVVDPVLLKGRSIQSSDIAAFRLEIRGIKEGAGIAIKRPKLKEKEAASPALTEDEKQRIIIDYLEKMLRELTR